MSLECITYNLSPCLFKFLSNPQQDWFELHITVAEMTSQDVQRFKAFCLSQRIKALVIELESETPIQHMTCSRVSGSFETALQEAKRVGALLEGQGFGVVRTKIEAAPWNRDVPLEAAPTNPQNYFEHHAKLLLPPSSNLLLLEGICTTHRAHLSRNAFKKLEGDSQLRFVTLRGYGLGKIQAEQHFAALLSTLKGAGFVVQDSITEFCVYDSNVALDGAWGKS